MVEYLFLAFEKFSSALSDAGFFAFARQKPRKIVQQDKNALKTRVPKLLEKNKGEKATTHTHTRRQTKSPHSSWKISSKASTPLCTVQTVHIQ